MRNRIEVSKNTDGRIEEGQILFGERKLLRFSNEWDDEGFLRSIRFEGQKSNLPTATELYWLMGEKFIERIRKIDLIDLIDRIALIDSITNIGTLANLTTVGTVNAITNIANIASLDLIDRITLIDGITNITNLASLDLIDRITLIDAITTISNITNIASLDLIDRITLIDTITNIATIGSIGSIGHLETVLASLNPIRNAFFINAFNGWHNGDAAKITIVDDATFGKVVKINNASPATLLQWVSIDSNKYPTLVFWGKRDNVTNIHVIIAYSDGTTTTSDVAVNPAWGIHSVSLTANKKTVYVSFTNSAANGICYVANPLLVESNAATVTGTVVATQDTRFNLRVDPERIDLLLKDLDFASNVALQTYLAAVGGQKHEVYAFGFEADADGTYYFSATVGGSVSKFAKLVTKGVYAQTLVHPIMCDVNTALNFMCTTGNAKTWIQYKTEA